MSSHPVRSPKTVLDRLGDGSNMQALPLDAAHQEPRSISRAAFAILRTTGELHVAFHVTSVGLRAKRRDPASAADSRTSISRGRLSAGCPRRMLS